MDGEALWSSRWPVEDLLARRREVDEYDWFSLYQCSPRARGLNVFRNTYFFDARPRALRYAIGLDLAYSESKRADYSVAVVLGLYEGKYYVLEILRERCEAPDFAEKLGKLQRKYRGARTRWYASGTERGNASFFRRLGVKLNAAPAISDKFVRAQPVAGAWNRGAILMPESENALLPGDLRRELEDGEGGPLDRSSEAPAWVDTAVSEITSFTGISDTRDDIVDAIAAAYDELASGGGKGSGDALQTYESPMGGW